METKSNRVHPSPPLLESPPLESIDATHVQGEDIEYEEHEDDNQDVEQLPEEPDQEDDGTTTSPLGTSSCMQSLYGQPVSAADATQACPDGDGGLIYHAHLVSDTWTHPKDCDSEGKIKPRRSTLPVRAKDFFASLVETQDGRWMFSGVLNGWPALTCLEVRSITCVGKRKTWLGKKKIVRFWDALPSEAKNGLGFDDASDDMFAGFGEERVIHPPPTFPKGLTSVRVTLRGAPWTAKGYSKASPGHVWWFESVREQLDARFLHGEDMILRTQEQETLPICTTVHHFAHRYARPGKKGYETQKQKLTYHGAILLEWNHGNYMTIVELATLNGVGGRKGKVNWHHDKSEPLTALYKAMSTHMIAPWKGKYAEIRVNDIHVKSLKEFKMFVNTYTGTELRFLDVHYIASAPVRLFSRRQTDIQRYLLNYMGRDRRYSEEMRNCQTFSADLYGFLAGKNNSVPYHKVCRLAYSNRSHNFLYSPEMYGAPHTFKQ